MHERLRRIARTGLILLLVASLVLVAVVALPSLVGAESSFVVLSGSMQPAIAPGDVVVVQSVDPGDVHEGDVVTFYADGPAGGEGTDRVTHRVVETVRNEGELAYRTKGDANAHADQSLVDHSQLVGTVQFHVPFVGRLFLLVQRPAAQLLLVVVPGLLLLIGGVQSFVGLLGGESTHSD
jgi:signal peptidase